MKVALFKVDTSLCAECSLALRRFIGGMDGMESIDVDHGKIAVRFDEAEIDEEKTFEDREGQQHVGERTGAAVVVRKTMSLEKDPACDMEVQNVPGTKEFEVIIKDVARVKERVFKFDAFVKSGGME